MKVTKITLNEGNRMLRLCLIGQHDGKLFSRIDLWWVGFRLTKE